MTIHRILKLPVGNAGDLLFVKVECCEDEQGHFLRASFAGKTRIERLKRRPSVVDAMCIADDVSTQEQEHEEV